LDDIFFKWASYTPTRLPKWDCQAAEADTTGEDFDHYYKLLNLVLNPVFDQIKHINFRKRKSDKPVSAMMDEEFEALMEEEYETGRGATSAEVHEGETCAIPEDERRLLAQNMWDNADRFTFSKVYRHGPQIYDVLLTKVKRQIFHRPHAIGKLRLVVGKIDWSRQSKHPFFRGFCC